MPGQLAVVLVIGIGEFPQGVVGDVGFGVVEVIEVEAEPLCWFFLLDFEETVDVGSNIAVLIDRNTAVASFTCSRNVCGWECQNPELQGHCAARRGPRGEGRAASNRPVAASVGHQRIGHLLPANKAGAEDPRSAPASSLSVSATPLT